MLANQDINLNVEYSNEVDLQSRTIRSVLTKVYFLCRQYNCILNASTNVLLGLLSLHLLYQLRKKKITSAGKYITSMTHIGVFQIVGHKSSTKPSLRILTKILA
jgi:hypothetical protein